MKKMLLVLVVVFISASGCKKKCEDAAHASLTVANTKSYIVVLTDDIGAELAQVGPGGQITTETITASCHVLNMSKVGGSVENTVSYCLEGCEKKTITY